MFLSNDDKLPRTFCLEYIPLNEVGSMLSLLLLPGVSAGQSTNFHPHLSSSSSILLLPSSILPGVLRQATGSARGRSRRRPRQQPGCRTGRGRRRRRGRGRGAQRRGSRRGTGGSRGTGGGRGWRGTGGNAGTTGGRMRRYHVVVVSRYPPKNTKDPREERSKHIEYFFVVSNVVNVGRVRVYIYIYIYIFTHAHIYIYYLYYLS